MSSIGLTENQRWGKLEESNCRTKYAFHYLIDKVKSTHPILKPNRAGQQFSALNYHRIARKLKTYPNGEEGYDMFWFGFLQCNPKKGKICEPKWINTVPKFIENKSVKCRSPQAGKTIIAQRIHSVSGRILQGIRHVLTT